MCVVAIPALAAMVRPIGANGTTIRRAARTRAIATAIGLDRVAVTVVVRAAGHATVAARAVVRAMVDVSALRVARAIRTAMRRQHLPATTALTARWWLKTLGRLNRSQRGLLRGPFIEVR